MSAWDDPVAHIRGLESKLAAVEVYVAGMLHEADHLDQIGDYDEAGAIRYYADRIRTALEGR